MRAMKESFFRLLIAALGCLALGGAFAQAPAQPSAPDVLVKSVTLEVVELLSKDKELKGDRAKLLRLVDAKVLPHFNFAAMSALAVGPAWKKASPEQQKQLTEEFKTMLVRTYASALSAYGSQKLEFRPLRAKPTDTDVTVHVRVLQPGAQPVALDYSMEKTPAGWKVYDMMVGGVSLVANYRTEFALKLRDSGVDGLIGDLQSKNRVLEASASAPKSQ
jgi:phospholipid transport system substrate-binding protein